MKYFKIGTGLFSYGLAGIDNTLHLETFYDVSTLSYLLFTVDPKFHPLVYLVAKNSDLKLILTTA